MKPSKSILEATIKYSTSEPDILLAKELLKKYFPQEKKKYKTKKFPIQDQDEPIKTLAEAKAKQKKKNFSKKANYHFSKFNP